MDVIVVLSDFEYCSRLVPASCIFHVWFWTRTMFPNFSGGIFLVWGGRASPSMTSLSTRALYRFIHLCTTCFVFPWHDGYKIADLAVEYDFKKGSFVNRRRCGPVREHGSMEWRNVNVALCSDVLRSHSLRRLEPDLSPGGGMRLQMAGGADLSSLGGSARWMRPWIVGRHMMLFLRRSCVLQTNPVAS